MMTSEKPGSRRRYSAELKAQILRECGFDGASVARVAMAHGINSNVVHRWRQLARDTTRPSSSPAEFIPVVMHAAPKQTVASGIEFQLRRGATSMTITWPVSEAAHCAVWLRELLR